MPDRVIRDELIRNRRYRRLPSDTHRVLFVHLALSADPFGNLEYFPELVGDLIYRPLSDAEAAEMLEPLIKADLIRPYQAVDKSFIHIPRYRQRLKFSTSRHPRPPEGVEDPWISTALQNKHLREKDGTVAVSIHPSTGTKPVTVRKRPCQDVDVDVDVDVELTPPSPPSRELPTAASSRPVEKAGGLETPKDGNGHGGTATPTATQPPEKRFLRDRVPLATDEQGLRAMATGLGINAEKFGSWGDVRNAIFRRREELTQAADRATAPSSQRPPPLTKAEQIAAVQQLARLQQAKQRP